LAAVSDTAVPTTPARYGLIEGVTKAEFLDFLNNLTFGHILERISYAQCWPAKSELEEAFNRAQVVRLSGAGRKRSIVPRRKDNCCTDQAVLTHEDLIDAYCSRN